MSEAKLNDNLKPIADDIGRVRAQIAALKERDNEMVQTLKDAGVSTMEGELFRVVISDVPDSIGPDWKAIAAKMKPSRQMLAANQKLNKKAHQRVTVSVRKGALA